ncbi:Tigger transposable element-derived protein 6 [Phytophthora cinnamomi]|uniref:Tigger transposable element-derived protein 6 n=1 Tax=Phytophthora cinnamomi TaxID=4785 RepID=UPI002A2C9DEE|nr:Tigger transposable element-derived protein 6 [Phytophthora cinnamomi]KAJ8524484.1 hypothetical protein ON010_g16634 [Phytophthora cinnamomi]
MDADIIASFKGAYRRRQLRWVYDKIKHAETIKKDVYAVGQLQAMQWSREVWKDLQTKDTIANRFAHTGIIFKGVDERSKEPLVLGLA